MKRDIQQINFLKGLLILAIGLLGFGIPALASTITTINGSDTLSASRPVINTNFTNLNTDKLESGSSPSRLTITNASTSLFSCYGTCYFGGTATVTISRAGVLTLPVALGISSGGTRSSTPLGGILLGDGTNPIKSLTIGTGLTFDGTTLSSPTGSPFPFTPTTNYGALANATATPIWFQSGLTSSSTVALGAAAGGEFLYVTGGKVSVGSTTPWGNFVINPIAGQAANQFVVGSSTATAFIITNAGRVGIGNTAPNGALDIQIPTNTVNNAILSVGNVNNQQAGILGNAGTNGVDFAITANLRNLLLDTNTGAVGIATATPWAAFAVNPKAGSASNQFVVGSSTATNFIVTNNGSVGIGTSTPYARLTLDRQVGVASSSIIVTEYTPATSTSMTVDCRDSNTIHIPIGTASVSLTLASMVAGQSCNVIVANPNGTGGTVTWAAAAGQTIYWAGGAVPTQTTTANKRDVWSFKADAEASNSTTTPGTTILGAASLNF